MAKKTIDGITADFQNGGWYQGRQYWNGQLGAPGVIINPNQQGAGQAVSREVVAQTNPNNVNYLQNVGDVQNHLNNLQNNFFSNYNGGDLPKVQTPAEIAQDLRNSGLLPTGEAPQAPKLLEQYSKLAEERGLSALEKDINDLKAEEDAIVAQFRVNSAAERGKPVAQNVIEGRVSEQQRSANEQLDFVQRKRARKVDEYNAAINSIKMIMDFTQQDYRNALDVYNSQFERAISTINLIRGIQNDQKDERQKAIDNARANLQVIRETILSGSVSYSSLSTDQKMLVNKLEIQAYGTTGLTAALRPQEKELDSFTDSRGNRVVVFYDPATRTTRNVITGNTGGGTGTGITIGNTGSTWQIKGTAPAPKAQPKPTAKTPPKDIRSFWPS